MTTKELQALGREHAQADFARRQPTNPAPNCRWGNATYDNAYAREWNKLNAAAAANR